MADPVTTVGLQPIVTVLYEAVRARLPLEGAVGGVRVVAGPDTSQRFAPRVVTLAATWDEDLEPVSTERVERGARPRVTETTTIACSAMAGGTGRDFASWREAVGELLTGIDQALRDIAADDRQTRRGYTRWIDWKEDDGANGAVVADFVVQVVTVS